MNLKKNKWCWSNWTTTCERVKLDHCLTFWANINSEWIKYLESENPKCIEETTDNLFPGISLWDVFADLTPIAKRKKKLSK